MFGRSIDSHLKAADLSQDARKHFSKVVRRYPEVAPEKENLHQNQQHQNQQQSAQIDSPSSKQVFHSPELRSTSEILPATFLPMAQSPSSNLTLNTNVNSGFNADSRLNSNLSSNAKGPQDLATRSGKTRRFPSEEANPNTAPASGRQDSHERLSGIASGHLEQMGTRRTSATGRQESSHVPFGRPSRSSSPKPRLPAPPPPTPPRASFSSSSSAPTTAIASNRNNGNPGSHLPGSHAQKDGAGPPVPATADENAAPVVAADSTVTAAGKMEPSTLQPSCDTPSLSIRRKHSKSTGELQFETAAASPSVSMSMSMSMSGPRATAHDKKRPFSADFVAACGGSSSSSSCSVASSSSSSSSCRKERSTRPARSERSSGKTHRSAFQIIADSLSKEQGGSCRRSISADGGGSHKSRRRVPLHDVDGRSSNNNHSNINSNEGTQRTSYDSVSRPSHHSALAGLDGSTIGSYQPPSKLGPTSSSASSSKRTPQQLGTQENCQQRTSLSPLSEPGFDSQMGLLCNRDTSLGFEPKLQVDGDAEDGVLHGSPCSRSSNMGQAAEMARSSPPTSLAGHASYSSALRESHASISQLQDWLLRSLTRCESLEGSLREGLRRQRELEEEVQTLNDHVAHWQSFAGEASEAQAETLSVLTLALAMLPEVCASVPDLDSQEASLKDYLPALRVHLSTALSEGQHEADYTNRTSDNSSKLLRLEEVEAELEQVTTDRERALRQLLEKDAQIEELQEEKKGLAREVRQLQNIVQELRGSIRVFCRLRPPLLEGAPLCLRAETGQQLAIRKPNGGRRQEFVFDRVYAENASQQDLFEEIDPLLPEILDGMHVCIFAYGQTGAGKTYTLAGDRRQRQPGLQDLAIDKLMKLCEAAAADGDCESVEVRLSALEIYNEHVRDLLVAESQGSVATSAMGSGTGGPAWDAGMTDESKLEIRQSRESLSGAVKDSGPFGSMHVPGLSSWEVHSMEDIEEALRRMRRNRHVATTALNERSSRSHCVLSLSITKTLRGSCSGPTTGVLHIVDLAGSERTKHSQVEGQQLKEANCTNRSLSSLADVLDALGDDTGGDQPCQSSVHVPYRNSKLTYLLQDSLGGLGCKTFLFAQVSPEAVDATESLSTLTFASRVARRVGKGRLLRPSTSSSSMSPARSGSLFEKPFATTLGCVATHSSNNSSNSNGGGSNGSNNNNSCSNNNITPSYGSGTRRSSSCRAPSRGTQPASQAPSSEELDCFRGSGTASNSSVVRGACSNTSNTSNNHTNNSSRNSNNKASNSNSNASNTGSSNLCRPSFSTASSSASKIPPPPPLHRSNSVGGTATSKHGAGDIRGSLPRSSSVSGSTRSSFAEEQSAGSSSLFSGRTTSFRAAR